MNENQVRTAVLRVLARIAPEADLERLDPRVSFRDQMEFDSMDFLGLVLGLGQELGTEIPEVEMSKLSTLEGCVRYLVARLGPGATP